MLYNGMVEIWMNYTWYGERMCAKENLKVWEIQLVCLMR